LTLLSTVANPGTVTFDTTVSDFGSDDEIDNGSTLYYVVKADVVKDDANQAENNDFVKVSFKTMDNSQVVYSSDGTTNNSDVTDLRIGLTKLDGTQINE
jgi:hypothetical protein